MVARAGRAAVLLYMAQLSLSCGVSGPLVISRSGTHTLEADLSGPGPILVSVTADNVTLNLNGKHLRCTPGSPSTAVTFGVAAEYRAGITIRNGSITGCKFGISAGYGHNILIEDVDFTGNTYIGANVGFGTGTVVRRCRFASITGYAAEAYAIGVNGVGQGGLVEDSVFEEIHRPPASAGVGEGVGILVEAGVSGVVVRGNTFSNREPKPHTVGIWSAERAAAEIDRNTVINFMRGVQGEALRVSGNTFRMTSAHDDSIAILGTRITATDNRIDGYQTPVSGAATQ